jgi:hypothetical protein
MRQKSVLTMIINFSNAERTCLGINVLLKDERHGKYCDVKQKELSLCQMFVQLPPVLNNAGGH